LKERKYPYSRRDIIIH